MKYCPRLFYEINFEPDCIQPCCDVQGIKVPRYPFTGGEVDMADYTRFVGHVLEKMQDGSLCAGCHELKEVEDTNLDLIFSIQAVTFNQHRYRCNCKCTYCNLWNNKKRGEPAYSVMPAIAALLKGDAPLDEKAWFHWGGGEPVILNEFEDACRYVCQKGHGQYIHTSALKHSPAIDRLLEVGLGCVNVSLDSGTPETYQKIKGLDGWSKVLESLEKYVKASISPVQVCAKYIIFEANNTVPEITRFFDVCDSLGIKDVSRSFDFRDVNANRVSEKSLVAAAFFAVQARRRGMECTSFFIAPHLQQKIDEITRQHFLR